MKNVHTPHYSAPASQIRHSHHVLTIRGRQEGTESLDTEEVLCPMDLHLRPKAVDAEAQRCSQRRLPGRAGR